MHRSRFRLLAWLTPLLSLMAIIGCAGHLRSGEIENASLADAASVWEGAIERRDPAAIEIDCTIGTNYPGSIVNGGLYLQNSRIALDGAQQSIDHGSVCDVCNYYWHGAEYVYDIIWAYDAQAKVFRNFNRASLGSQAFFGVSRNNSVLVKLRSGTGTANYNSSWDDIEVYRDNMWGSAGRRIAAHEYGHAVHEKALNGYDGSTCPAEHHQTLETNLNCAFSEGFAEYHANAVGMKLRLRLRNL